MDTLFYCLSGWKSVCLGRKEWNNGIMEEWEDEEQRTESKEPYKHC